SDTDPLGKSQHFNFGSASSGAGWRVDGFDQLNRSTHYETQRPDANTVIKTVTGPDQLPSQITVHLDGAPSLTPAGTNLFSSQSVSANGYTVYSQANTPAGAQFPIASKTIEIMGMSAGAPSRTTTHTRAYGRSNQNDPTTLQSYDDQVTVNGR